MFDSNDIYRHLKNGGSFDELQKALENEFANAQDRIIKEKEAELKEQKAREKINKARSTASKALKDYFALVNPNVTDNVINFVLDTLGTVEIEVNEINGIRGKRANGRILEQTIDLTDEEWKTIWNTVFPFHSKRK